MELYGVRVFVDDLCVARRFYGEILGLKRRWEFGNAIGYDLGAELIVELDDGSEPGLVGRYVGVSIRVDDIQDAFCKLAASGVTLLGSPQKQPWGGTLAHFKDPAGNILTLLG
jgi:predicted enzyme related to lactoylglutathione lyase